MDVVPVRQQVEHVAVPLNVNVVLFLRLLRPERHLLFDEGRQFLSGEGKEVDDLVDAPEELVPPEVVLQNGLNNCVDEND